MRNRLLRFLTASLAAVGAGAAPGAPGDQLNKLTADDGQSLDHFGASVAISGNTVVIGARFDDDNGPDSGSVYVYDAATGAQLMKLLPFDGEQDDDFGFSVAISGITALVGASRDDDACLFDSTCNSGSAYLFDTTNGLELFKLVADDDQRDDEFGFSVAISGTTALVGAHRDDVACVIDPNCNSGSAYLFDTATGQQLFKLVPDDSDFEDAFGWSVGISGSTAIIAAYFNDDNGSNSGSAYLFDTVTGQQLFKLLPDDGEAEDQFGFSVAISGTTAIVGAQFDDDNGAASGSAYLFDAVTGQQLFKLLPDDGAAGDEFGYSVAISGLAAIVGSRLDDDNGTASGSAYVFDITTGQQIFKYISIDGSATDFFGIAVGISGSTAVIGANQDDDNGGASGSAYLFDSFLCPLTDLNNDNIVNTADLGILINQFGTPGPEADLNDDGVVNTADLGILINDFGVFCP